MNLLREIAVVGIALAFLGCNDAAGPPTLPAAYNLSTINGRALPTALTAFPESPVVTYSLLQLDADGNASITENRQTQIAPGEVTYTTNYTYTIRGNVIEFHLDCPPTAFCSPPPVGVFNGPHLYLTFKSADVNIVYDYLQGVLDFALAPEIIANDSN